MRRIDSDKSLGGFRPGFSERFNYLLDLADYPSINKGRITQLAVDEKMSRTGVRKWLVENNPPKGPKLGALLNM